jgi:hypothetical protein
MLFAPRIIDAHDFDAACHAVQTGMSVQQALSVIETKGEPRLERLDGNMLNAGPCEITLSDGKVTEVSVRPNLTGIY